MVVLAILRAPHGMHEGAIWRLFASKPDGEAGEAAQRRVGLAIAGTFLEFDLAVLARGLAALEQDVSELADGAALGNIRKAAVAQDRGFQRELRREPAAHLRRGASLPGLVVEDRIGAVGALLDAIGPRGKPERAIADRDLHD